MKTGFDHRDKKIICPIDFTVAAMKGLEYAGHLAKELGGRLTIFYVRPGVWPGNIQLYEDANDTTKGLKRLLQVTAQEVEKNFGVPCDYEFESAKDSLEATIGTLSSEFDLIIMGASSESDSFQHVFGRNSDHVLGRAKCPVLIVPENATARIPKTIVLAFNSEANPIFMVEQLQEVTNPINARVMIIHAASQPLSLKEKERLEILELALHAEAYKGTDWVFTHVHDEDIAQRIDAYMEESGADLLALSYHHRTMYEKLFGHNVLKEITCMATYPLLVFWH